MTRIFCNVVADIDKELESKFPSDFDFYAMIRKVSEDAGVEVHIRSELGKKLVALHGVWVAMERVHSLLATTLAVYGARVTPIDTPGESRLNNISDENKHELIDSSNFNINSNGERTITNVNTPWNGGTESIDLNESHLKEQAEISRNSDSNSQISNQRNFDSECDESSQTTDEDHYSDHQLVDEYKESDHDSSDYEHEMTTEKRGRGRPRKNPPKSTSQRICTKICSKYGHRGKRKKLKLPLNEGAVKVNRGRGRPRKFPDGEPKEFPCPDCDFMAKSRNTLGDHKHRVHLANPTKCDICLKVFPNARYMRRHRASHIEPQHCCDVCGKMYKIRKAMLDHKKTHEEGYSRPSFPCDMCSKSFCSNYILACHIKSEHLGQKKSFLCSICGKSFTTKHSLQEHSNAHTGAKPHVCDVCGKGFCYESALRDHKFVHVTSKQFICEICSKGFSQRSGLKMHMRIHESNKQFVCSDCGREFTQKQALQRHERVHKGDKPFICKLCAKTFSDASIIRRHMILVHKIHKDANTWREDIICKVQGAVNYHVEKILDVDNAEATVNKQLVSTAGTKALGAISFNEIKGSGSSKSKTHESNTTYSLPGGNRGSPVDQADKNPQLQPPGAWYQNQPDHQNQDVVIPNSNTSQGVEIHLPEPNSKFANIPGHTNVQESIQREDRGEASSPSSSYLPHSNLRLTGYIHDISMNRPAHYASAVQERNSDSYAYSLVQQGKEQGKLDSYTAVTSPNLERPFLTERESGVSNYEQQSSEIAVSHFDVLPVQRTETLDKEPHVDTVSAPVAAAAASLPSGSIPSSSQPWSSMYAYYSHLASQFGMTLNDYPYMANINSSHQ